MKLLKTLLLLASFAAAPAFAADNPADAVAIVDKGVAFLNKNGKDALIKEVNAKNPDFIKGDIYLVVRGMDGATLAHPINAKLIGKNLIDLPDADGKFFRKEIIELAKTKGKGWVDYKYLNPTTKGLEPKSTYITKAGDVIVEAGIYKAK